MVFCNDLYYTNRAQSVQDAIKRIALGDNRSSNARYDTITYTSRVWSHTKPIDFRDWIPFTIQRFRWRVRKFVRYFLQAYYSCGITIGSLLSPFSIILDDTECVETRLHNATVSKRRARGRKWCYKRTRLVKEVLQNVHVATRYVNEYWNIYVFFNS
jgi:hypothetical protein